jgi:hypothetical protein
MLHAAARLTRGSRQRYLKIQASWAWAADIVNTWNLISALPHAPDQHKAAAATKEGAPGTCRTPGHPARQHSRSYPSHRKQCP